MQFYYGNIKQLLQQLISGFKTNESLFRNKFRELKSFSQNFVTRFEKSVLFSKKLGSTLRYVEHFAVAMQKASNNDPLNSSYETMKSNYTQAIMDENVKKILLDNLNILQSSFNPCNKSEQKELVYDQDTQNLSILKFKALKEKLKTPTLCDITKSDFNLEQSSSIGEKDSAKVSGLPMCSDDMQNNFYVTSDKNSLLLLQKNTKNTYPLAAIKKPDKLCVHNTESEKNLMNMKDKKNKFFSPTCLPGDLETVKTCVYDNNSQTYKTVEYKQMKVNETDLSKRSWCSMTQAQKEIKVTNSDVCDVANEKKNMQTTTELISVPFTKTKFPAYKIKSLPVNKNSNELRNLWEPTQPFFENAKTFFNSRIDRNPKTVETCPSCFEGNTNDEHKVLQYKLKQGNTEYIHEDAVKELFEPFKLKAEKCDKLKKCQFQTLDPATPYKKWHDVQDTCKKGKKTQERAPNLIALKTGEKQRLPDEEAMVRVVKCHTYDKLHFWAFASVVVYAILVFLKMA